MVGTNEKYQLLLQWIIFAGALVFGLWLAWQVGILADVLARDPTYMSHVIGLLFIGATLHCGVRALFLAQQLNMIDEMTLATTPLTQPLRLAGDTISLHGRPLASTLPTDYLRSVLIRYQGTSTPHELPVEHTQLTEILAERARGQHEMGWFISGLALKLGLLGTVIGFVMMLGSVSGIESFEVSDVKVVLSNMTVGMGVALNTTLAGLVASILLGFQYLLLDRGADRLVSQTVYYAQTAVIPRLAAAD